MRDFLIDESNFGTRPFLILLLLLLLVRQESDFYNEAIFKLAYAAGSSFEPSGLHINPQPLKLTPAAQLHINGCAQRTRVEFN